MHETYEPTATYFIPAFETRQSAPPKIPLKKSALTAGVMTATIGASGAASLLRLLR
jgi:hypothetical protein